MTTDTKLLPLPEMEPFATHGSLKKWASDYARSCVANATAAKDAEIDALRTRLEDTVRDSTNEIEALKVDIEAWKASHSMLTDTCHHFQARAERLAEALRPLAALDLTADDFDQRPDSQPIYARNNTGITVGDVRKARAALHPTAAQENDDAAST